MKPLNLTLAVFLVAGLSAHALTFTNSTDADTFVRSNAPTLNYGGAGALSVSGAISTNTASGLTNGIADSFLRFNTASLVTNFNAVLGTNNWVVTGVRLQATETGTPNNNIFDQGKGGFEIHWIANDNWTEGTGTPNAATTDGLAFANESALLNPGTDLSLGFFTNNAANGTLLLPLSLPAAFTGDVKAGGEVTLFLTATDAKTGFTFNSRSFGTASARPFLLVSATAVPGITGIYFSGTNLVLNATNGVAGGTYYVLSGTNLAVSPSRWTPVLTNVLAAGGNFSLTLTNAVNAQSSAQQFFIIRTQ